MRAHKRNPFWGQGLDKRQARRRRRRSCVRDIACPGLRHRTNCPWHPSHVQTITVSAEFFERLVRECDEEFGPHEHDDRECAWLLDAMSPEIPDPLNLIPSWTPDSWLPDNPNEDGFRQADFI